MASTNGNGNGNRATAFDRRALLDETGEITDAAMIVARVAGEVSESSDAQMRSVESALSGVNELSLSLRETASQAESVSASTESLVSSINEVAASIEQVTSGTDTLASAVRQVATSMQQSNASMQSITGTTQEMATSAQQVTTSMVEMSASVKSVTVDTESLASSVNETAASLEEMTRSIQGVAASADDLAATAEQSSSSIGETAASIEEVTAMTESLAATIEQTAAAGEELSRSVQSVAQNGQRISEAAGAAATTATELERAGQSLAALAKSADEITRRSSRDAEEGGVSVQRAIQGFGRVRTSVAQSATVIRDMGKRANDISSIVDTINLIAERTNLLSLNASIEAARAGDAGRGFAVVAEEIRNLADRSAKATSDIAAIIKALQEVAQDAVTSSNEGLRVIDDSNLQAEEGAKGLRKILDGVTEASKVVGQISRAADEQRDAGRNVVAAITSTAEQARLVAASTEEQAASVNGVVQANTQIRRTVQEVKKAMAEQARAARDILKAAQNTKDQSALIRRATAEQAKTATQAMQVAESMRRGAATSARAMGEQAAAGEQILPLGRRAASDGLGRHQGDRRTGGGHGPDHHGGREHARPGRSGVARGQGTSANDERDDGGGPEHVEADQIDHGGQPRTVQDGGLAGDVARRNPANHRTERKQRQAHARRHRRSRAACGRADGARRPRVRQARQRTTSYKRRVMSPSVPLFGIFTTDADLVVRTWDPFIARITGIRPEQALNRPLDAVLPDAQHRIVPLLRQVLLNGTIEILAPALHAAFISSRPSDTASPRMQQRVTIGPLRDEGRIVGVAVTVEDVTARVEHENELAEKLSAGRLATLTRVLDEDDWRTRQLAVRGLAAHGAAIVDAVVRTLREQHRNLNVLSSLLDLLASADIDIVEQMIACLKDEEADLRIQSALILGERRDRRAVPALVAALGDPDVNVRFHAIEALGTLRAVEAIEVLVDIATSGDFFLAFPAVHAISQLGDVSVAPRLVPLLTDGLLQATVAEALGAIGDELVVEPLVGLLNQADAPTDVIADALSALYERYEERYHAGDHIASLVRRAIGPVGTQNLLDAVSRVDADRLRGIARVMGWLNGAAVQRALTQAPRPALRPRAGRGGSGSIRRRRRGSADRAAAGRGSRHEAGRRRRARPDRRSPRRRLRSSRACATPSSRCRLRARWRGSATAPPLKRSSVCSLTATRPCARPRSPR